MIIDQHKTVQTKTRLVIVVGLRQIMYRINKPSDFEYSVK